MFLIFHLLFPLPTPPPTYFTHIEPCKILVASHIMPKIIVSLYFNGYYSCRLTIHLFLHWVLFLSSNNTFVSSLGTILVV